MDTYKRAEAIMDAMRELFLEEDRTNKDVVEIFEALYCAAREIHEEDGR